MIKTILLVGLGGFAGSVMRYLLSTMMIRWTIMLALPLGTFTVNVLGSLLIGLALAWTGNSGAYFLCVVGFCGGFTTFSTFSVELLTMLRAGDISAAGIYSVVSIVVCVAATWFGLYIGDKIKL